MTVVEGNHKAPFSIATIPKCRGGRYSFPRIAPLYPWYVPYIAECQAPFLKALVWGDLGLNSGLPDYWWKWSLNNYFKPPRLVNWLGNWASWLLRESSILTGCSILLALYQIKQSLNDYFGVVSWGVLVS